VGDKVIPARYEAEYVVSAVWPEGKFFNLTRPGYNLDLFHVATDTLTFVDHAPRKSAAPAIPTLDAEEVNVRINAVRRESLERLDGDIAILTKYLKTQGAPKAAIDTLETLRSEQHESWDKAVERIEELLEE
jgi:hypothetical protein